MNIFCKSHRSALRLVECLAHQLGLGGGARGAVAAVVAWKAFLNQRSPAHAGGVVVSPVSNNKYFHCENLKIFLL